MPPHGPTNQHKHELEITAEDRGLLWRLLRASGSKAMPDDMEAFVSGIFTAVGRYRQSEAEDHRRRSAREDLRDLFMACRDQKNVPKIRRRFPKLSILVREELVRRAKARHPDMNGGADLTWEGLCAWAQSCPDEELRHKLPGLIAAGRVAELALLWLESTGNPPPSSRSDKQPFGRMAHLVLGKAGVVSPHNALRRYWASVKRHRIRPSNIPVG